MKSVITKISSFTIALLVLFSTLSFTVEKHFCCDVLVDISYIGNAGNCKTKLKKDTCNTSITKKKSCCKDETENIKGQDNLKITSLEKLTFEQHFAVFFAISYKNLFVNLTNKIVPHKNYSPPNLVFDIHILHEVFTI